jgi:hypothetical protein
MYQVQPQKTLTISFPAKITSTHSSWIVMQNEYIFFEGINNHPAKLYLLALLGLNRKMSRCNFGKISNHDVNTMRTEQGSTTSSSLSLHPLLLLLLPYPLTHASTIIWRATTHADCCDPTLPICIGNSIVILIKLSVID